MRAARMRRRGPRHGERARCRHHSADLEFTLHCCLLGSNSATWVANALRPLGFAPPTHGRFAFFQVLGLAARESGFSSAPLDMARSPVSFAPPDSGCPTRGTCKP